MRISSPQSHWHLTAGPYPLLVGRRGPTVFSPDDARATPRSEGPSHRASVPSAQGDRNLFHNLMSEVNWRGRLLAASTGGVIALGSIAAAATAQETASDTVRPASIHTGSCDAPGEVVAELRDLVVMFDDDDSDDDGSESSSGAAGASTPPSDPGSDDDADGGDDTTDDDDDNADDSDDGDDTADDGGARSGGEFVGPDDASVVEGSEDSNIGTTLDALLAEPHVIAVFESDGSETIIACGSIGGFASADDDDLAVGLREQNGSGFAGVALLDDDDDDNELDVDVYIARDVAVAT